MLVFNRFSLTINLYFQRIQAIMVSYGYCCFPFRTPQKSDKCRHRASQKKWGARPLFFSQSQTLLFHWQSMR